MENREQKIKIVAGMYAKGVPSLHFTKYANDNQIEENELNELKEEALLFLTAEEQSELVKQKVLLTQLDDLYMKNYMIQDYRECRSILNDKQRVLEKIKEEELKDKRKKKLSE